MKKKVLIGIGIALVVIIMIVANIIRNQGEPGVRVDTSKAALGKIKSTLFLEGKVDLKEQRDIRSKVIGEIKSVKVSIGQKVTKGQVLVYIDTSDLVNQKEQAEEQLNLAKEKRNQVRNAPVIPGQGSNSSAVKAADIEVKSAQSAIDKIKRQIEEATIKSPVDGIVLYNNAQIGMNTSPENTLMTIGNINDLMIKAQVTEMDYLKIKKGQRVKITGEAFSQEYEGQVVSIAQVPTPGANINGLEVGGSKQTETSYQVDIKIVSKNSALKPGFTTSLEVVTENKSKALVVPNEAVVEKDEKSVVYVVKQGKVKIAEVKIGIEGDDKTEIIKGIKAGDVVILNPDENILKENSKVKINDQNK